MTENQLATTEEKKHESKFAAISVNKRAGGIDADTMEKMFTYAQAIARGQVMVPDHLRDNPGACFIVLGAAYEWGVSAFAAISQSYIVNNRACWGSQLVHAIIEKRAPLQERLNCEYFGEAGERQCRVFGRFIGDSADREYMSPQIQNIKPQNSPLWKNDPDQQLFYYSVRAWARKWAPDILLGVYTRDEIEDNPDIPDRRPGFAARLVGGTDIRPETGHRDGFVDQELAQLSASVADASQTPTEAPTEEQGRAGEQEAAPSAKRTGKPRSKRRMPKNAEEYMEWAEDWIMQAETLAAARKRFESEYDIRNDLKVRVAQRKELEDMIEGREYE